MAAPRLNLFLIMIALLPGRAFAHPVPYQEAVGAMVWNQPFLSDYWLTYSFRHDTAIAARAMRMEMEEGRTWFYGPQLDFLVRRWNQPNLQANIYVYGSFGGLKGSSQSGTAALGGLEVDAESRKYYISGKLEGMIGSFAPNFYASTFRLGIAPYEAEFSELASWLMIQAEHHPSLTRDDAITPLIRVFYKSFLVEAGVSFEGDGMLNFMFHF